ncbi:hypothetical protein BWK47_02665 [Synechocystis sp. CACIAM 05]|nr:hypothetical protein BWK47_02665 [Synechocystis sp. CACIAM 05]
MQRGLWNAAPKPPNFRLIVFLVTSGQYPVPNTTNQSTALDGNSYHQIKHWDLVNLSKSHE